MSDSVTITREQLRTVYVATELGAKMLTRITFPMQGLLKTLIHSVSFNTGRTQRLGETVSKRNHCDVRVGQ
jgi:hypothetical protein